MKVVTTDFGIVEVKPKKVFEHNGIKYAIVEVPYKYLNSEEILYMKKCVHYITGWQIPIYRPYNKTIKDFIRVSKEVLGTIFKDLGECRFNQEIDSKEPLNI